MAGLLVDEVGDVAEPVDGRLPLWPLGCTVGA